MIVGIVGNEAAKFTEAMELETKRIIRSIIRPGEDSVCSGGCHLGGVDIWAEEIAMELGVPLIIHNPKKHQWTGGYKDRNLLIARDSDEVHVIVVRDYHRNYTGMKFPKCYHCNERRGTRPLGHVKSGACWTAYRAMEMGKMGLWHIVEVDDG